MQAVELLVASDVQREIPTNKYAWLFKTTELLVRNELRKQARTISIDLVDQESLSIDRLEYDAILKSDVEVLFISLSSDEREIIRKRDILGLTVDEAATIEDVSIKAIYHKHERAKHKARRILGKPLSCAADTSAEAKTRRSKLQ